MSENIYAMDPEEKSLGMHGSKSAMIETQENMGDRSEVCESGVRGEQWRCRYEEYDSRDLSLRYAVG
jgi:hypothetical protein